MSILVGSTGFVGTHLARQKHFDQAVHRTDVDKIAGSETDLLVCAAMPGEKWRANEDPETDWVNMAALAQILSGIAARRAVLISTIDVYQPAVEVDESDVPDFIGPGRYGAHRAWFECFFRAQFPHSLILRLPGLFANDLRKNLIYDLMMNRPDQLSTVSPRSQFQFFDVSKTWNVAEKALEADIELLNVATEPVLAQDVAALFGESLNGLGTPVLYDMRSIHHAEFGGSNGYLFDRASVMHGIAALTAAKDA